MVGGDESSPTVDNGQSSAPKTASRPKLGGVRRKFGTSTARTTGSEGEAGSVTTKSPDLGKCGVRELTIVHSGIMEGAQLMKKKNPPFRRKISQNAQDMITLEPLPEVIKKIQNARKKWVFVNVNLIIENFSIQGMKSYNFRH